MSDKKMIGAHCPADLHRRLTEAAKRRDLTRSAAVRQAVRRWLRDLEAEADTQGEAAS
ncbi:MAG: ribbon-helix-helix protein, CopG family [Nannocystaceae bacterium]|nr:ribbon-helix-helix domain-containing protein [bacterium]